MLGQLPNAVVPFGKVEVYVCSAAWKSTALRRLMRKADIVGNQVWLQSQAAAHKLCDPAVNTQCLLPTWIHRDRSNGEHHSRLLFNRVKNEQPHVALATFADPSEFWQHVAIFVCCVGTVRMGTHLKLRRKWKWLHNLVVRPAQQTRESHVSRSFWGVGWSELTSAMRCLVHIT